MNKYDFNRLIDRRGTSCLKYDFAIERKGTDDLLPLWVADMDFRLPDEILEEMHSRVNHGIFGYTNPNEDYRKSVIDWFRDIHDFSIEPEWITVTPGVVFAIAIAIRAFTEDGDSVLINRPVYYPFQECIEDNHRIMIDSPLVLKNGRYTFDFDDFEDKIVRNSVKLFLLCNPHNPVGRVWKREELEKISEICLRHGVTVFSDEIHCDILYPEVSYLSYAKTSDTTARHAIIGTSASKTFNIAGLQTSNIIISDREMRKKYRAEINRIGYSQPNVLGLTATQAAYTHGRVWYKEMLEYLNENLNYVRQFIVENIPKVKLIEPDGTYLVWLDFSALKISHAERQKLILEKAKLWLDDGMLFGPQGEQFERINIACPRETLELALNQLKSAVDELEEPKGDN